jgi:hypothetical protein
LIDECVGGENFAEREQVHEQTVIAGLRFTGARSAFLAKIRSIHKAMVT